MKKIILAIFIFLFLSINSWSAAPSRVSTYTSGTEILASDVTANEDALFNYTQAGVDTYADDSIVNADINSSANIQSDKLNLTSIAQAVGITSAGSFANVGSTTLTGAFSATGTSNTIGNGGSDVLTLNVPGGITLSAATTWTLTGALTFSGTIADLGTVTTANIDGGTLDGVQIGGTTATGELIINDSNDDADGLGSQGTDGQVLTSVGSGSLPAFENLPGAKANFLVRLTGTGATCTFDETGGFDTGSNFAPNTFTVPLTGKYQFNIRIQLTKDATSTLRNPAFHLRESTIPSNLNDFTESVTTDSQVFALTYNILIDLTAAQTIILVLDTLDSTTATVNNIEASYWSAFLVAE